VIYEIINYGDVVKVGSLFSGIGGFDLGLERSGMEITWQVEIDPFCNKVLAKHWPNVKRYGDIKNVTNLEPVDLICGGFPCQPYSCAGKRKGKDDDRALWPEMLRVVSEVKPRWIIGENVAGFIDMGLDDCISDLENQGYEVQAFIIPACAVNAPHRRDRVWICAHSLMCEHGAGNRQIGETDGVRGINRAALCAGGIVGADCHAADTTDTGSEGLRREREDTVFSNPHAADTDRLNGDDAGLDSGEVSQLKEAEVFGMQSTPDAPHSTEQRGFHTEFSGKNRAWDEPWIEAASRLCGVSYGLPDRLVRYSLTMPVTNGIIGFILMLRRYHYATSKETRAREVLPILQEAFGEESVQRCFGKLSEVFREEDLWCPVHGKVDGEREENKIGIPEGSCEVSRESVREMRNGKEYRNPSQRRRLDKQCTCEFDDIVFELSHEIALGEWQNNAEKAENILFDLWESSAGTRFLHEPLSALHEVWRSVTDKEIGSFRRHLDKRNKNRVQKLKALGNAVVPQIVEIIGRVIMEIERCNAWNNA